MTSFPLDAAPRSARSDQRVRSARPRPGRRPVRLTPLGRVVLLLLLTLLALLAVTLLGRAGTAAAGDAPSVPATRLVVVQPGDSLWTIAQAVAPGEDPREVVNRLQQLNHLDTAVVVPGQPVVVPARA